MNSVKRALICVSVWIIWGCGAANTGRGTAAAQTEASGPAAEDSQNTGSENDGTNDTDTSADGPADEMMPGLAVVPSGNRTWVHAEDSALDGKDEDLFEKAKEAAKQGEMDEAFAIIDLLLLKQPDNLDYLEFRGMLQLRQGDVEDGNADLERCCRMGRQTCCQSHQKE